VWEDGGYLLCKNIVSNVIFIDQQGQYTVNHVIIVCSAMITTVLGLESVLANIITGILLDSLH
jgi:hypothetical protein